MTQTTSTAQLSALLDQGLGHIAAGRGDEAGQCFENIIKAGAGAGSLTQRDKPLIAQAHNQLGIKAMAGGMFHEAFGHFEAAREIAGFDPSLELNRGLALINLGRLEEAEGAFSGVLEKNPGDPQAAFHLGKIYLKQGRAEKAVPCLEQAAKAAPSRVEIYLELGMSLELSGKKPEAAKQFEKVRGMSPDLYQHYYKKAEELKENHYYPDAYETLVRASKILPDNPIPHHMVAILFQDLGKKDQAEEFLKKSLGLHPTPESYSQLAALYEKSNALNDAWATANTGLQLFPDDAYLQLTLARCERRAKKFGQALKRLLGLEGKTSDRIIKTQMHFLIGLLYDQQDEIDNAFSYYAKAKKEAAANLDKSTADKEISFQYIRDMSQLDLSKLPRAKPPARPGGPAGVAFLVGFPRSGTTLLNQILDSHPQLVGLEEKPTIPGPAALLMQMAAGYPKALEGLSEDMAEKLREAYYQRIESFTDFEADSIVIDKLPLNLIHLPLIWAMFPEAKIIMALRHPLGCALSCFMHNFQLNNAMANMFTLEDITSFYTKVMDLWRHFTSAREFPCHLIKYEDVVTDIRGEAEKICSFLGVEWSDEMLKYAQHARAKGLISTPSYHQVIQPLYSDSLERWRRYEKYLEPYQGRLAPYCDMFGYRL